MSSASRALIWRQWRIIRLPALITLLAVSAILLLDFLITKTTGVSFDVEVGWIVLAGATEWFGAYLLCTGSSINDLSIAFPKLLFGLPLRTSTITAHELGGRAIALGLLTATMASSLAAIAWLGGGISALHASPGEILLDVVASWLLVIAAFSVVQAVCWWPGGLPMLVVLLVVSAFYGPLRLVVIDMASFVAHSAPMVRILLALAAIGLSYFMALGAVHLARRGGISIRGANTDDLYVLTLRLYKGPQTPFWAQCRYEWHRFGRLLPAMFMPFLALLVVSMYTIVAEYSIAAQDIFGGPMIFSVVVYTALFSPVCISLAAFVLGVLVLTRDVNERGRLQEFVFVRPISSRRLALARLAAGSAGIVASIVLVVGLIVLQLLFLLPGRQAEALHEIFRMASGGLDSLTPAIVTALVFIISIWTVLWLGGPIVVTIIGVVYPIIGVAQLATLAGVSANDATETTVAILGVAFAIGFWVLSGAAWRTSIRKQLASRRTCVAAVLAWPAIVTLLHWHAALQSLRPSSAPTGDVWQWFAEEAVILTAALVAVLPLASVPLTFDRLRHR